MRTKGKVSRASEVTTVIRHFEPDMERQVRALLIVLGGTIPDNHDGAKPLEPLVVPAPTLLTRPRERG